MADQTNGEWLVCPDDEVRLREVRGDDETVFCPNCGYTCQNFLKYPEAVVVNPANGETYLMNVLTGERVD